MELFFILLYYSLLLVFSLAGNFVKVRIVDKFIDKSINCIINNKVMAVSLFLFFLIFSLLSPVLFHEVTIFFKLAVALIFATFLFYFFYAGFYPAELASKIVRSFHRITRSELISGYWSLYNKNKFSREFVLFSLAVLVFAGLIFEIYLFIFLSINVFDSYSLFQNILMIAVFVLVLFFVFLVDRFSFRDSFSFCRHKRDSAAKNLLDTVSITAGLDTPHLKIIKSKALVAFSKYEDNDIYCVYISLSLLEILNDNELSAVFAHEVSKIKSGITRDFRYIVLFLQFFKIISAGFFLLLLGLYSSYLFYAWTAVLFLLSLERLNKSIPFENTENGFYVFILTFFFPNFTIMNFVSALIFYFLSYREIFLADLQAVLVTRYPEGLYGALRKIKLHKFGENMYGLRLDRLYFSDEAVFSEIPSLGAPIKERMKLLERLDTNIKNTKLEPKKARNINCLLCHHDMHALKVDSHYLKKNVEIDQCKNCLSVWFDDDELLYIADLLSLCQKDKYKKSNLNYSHFEKYFMCPRCGIALKKQNNISIPDEVVIYYCNSCEGRFLLHDDIYEYGMIRLKKKI
ncbi:hypothetical protein C0583_00055 [Candidatus Parcubacteria bacterium]|nr:MAG: hypothetical protein C0583_00055 [Candidatus Parcubacteria bacterium]